VFSFKKHLFIAVLLVLLAALPAAAQQHSMTMPTDAIKFNITLTDYSFVVEGQAADQPLELQAGQAYELHFKNDSATQMAHEVLFGKDPTIIGGQFKHDFTTPLLGDVPVMLSNPLDKDFMVNVPGLDQFQIGVGKEITLDFTLPDDKVGDWELGCFEYVSMDNNDENPGPTHYDKGMHLPIIVKPAMAM
jgi:hypothetical protein